MPSLYSGAAPTRTATLIFGFCKNPFFCTKFEIVPYIRLIHNPVRPELNNNNVRLRVLVTNNSYELIYCDYANVLDPMKLFLIAERPP